MKRIYLLFVSLAVFLTACQVSVDVIRVNVSPSTQVLAPGGSIVLSASLSTGGTSNFTWTATGGTLSSTTGASVTYTAPTTAGQYIITVESLVGLSGKATITVPAAIAATPDPNTPVVSGETILAGQKDLYSVSVPAGLSGSVVYFELEGSDLKLTLRDASNKAIAESSSAAFFSKAGSSSALKTQAISVETICRGSCIIIKNVPGQYFLEVQASQSTTYNLFAFGDVYQDTADEAGETCSVPSSSLKTAAAITVGPNIGAIETLDDLDCIDANAAKQIILSTGVNTSIRISADIYSKGSLLTTLNAGPGEGTDTFASTSEGDFNIIIRGNNQAAPAKGSKYSVTIN